MPLVEINEGDQPVIQKCGVCGVAYDTKEEYEEHCKAEPMKHLQKGHAPCIYCGKKVDFTTMPFTKELEPTPAVCDNCFDTIVKPSLVATGRMKQE